MVKVKLTKAQKEVYNELIEQGLIEYTLFTHQAGSGEDQSLIPSLVVKKLIKG